MINKKTCSVAAIAALVVSFFSEDIRTTFDGLLMTGNAEGCIAEPYKCQANITTIGVGSTSGTIENRLYSDEEIAQRWASDIKAAEQCVNQYGNGQSLPQPVFDAVVSITFNVGCTKMRSSTMYRYLNANELLRACNEFPRWKYAGGVVLNGLVKRRGQEQTLCLTGIQE